MSPRTMIGTNRSYLMSFDVASALKPTLQVEGRHGGYY